MQPCVHVARSVVQGGPESIDKSVDDENLKEVISAFKALGVSQAEIDVCCHVHFFWRSRVQSLFSIVGAILHLGQIEYSGISMSASHSAHDSPNPAADTCKVSNPAEAESVARLLSLPSDKFAAALVHQTIVARGQEIKSHLNVERALYAREAVSKVRG